MNNISWHPQYFMAFTVSHGIHKISGHSQYLMAIGWHWAQCDMQLSKPVLDFCHCAVAYHQISTWTCLPCTVPTLCLQHKYCMYSWQHCSRDTLFQLSVHQSNLRQRRMYAVKSTNKAIGTDTSVQWNIQYSFHRTRRYRQRNTYAWQGVQGCDCNHLKKHRDLVNMCGMERLGRPVVTLLRQSGGTAPPKSRLSAHARTSSRLRRVFSPRPSSLVTGSSRHGMTGFRLPLDRMVVTWCSHTR